MPIIKRGGKTIHLPYKKGTGKPKKLSVPKIAKKVKRPVKRTVKAKRRYG